jgi:hypothetical protein
MRRVIFLVSVALVLSATGCAKHHARRYAPAYYAGDACGCDGAVVPMGGVVAPGPLPLAPPVLAPAPAAVGKSISSTPIQVMPAPQ